MNLSPLYLSIVIPQYNELANLRRGVLEEVANYLKSQSFTWEVIIVDDGSSDNSYHFVQDFVKRHTGFKLIQINHAGKPNALLAGISTAQGKYLLTTDMDQSTPIAEMEKLFPFIDGFEIVIGSRGNIRKNATLFRQIASFVFGTFRRVLILSNIIDTQCGFKLFRADIAKRLFPLLESVKIQTATGWTVTAFDVELLFLAEKLGYKIKEVKVNWLDQDTSETKNRKFLNESIDMLKQILKIRWKNLRAKYDALKTLP